MMFKESGKAEVKSPQEETHNVATAGEVFRDFVAGMYHEVKQHPGKLAIEAGAGAALAVGSLLVAPEIGAGIAIVGTAAALYEGGKGLMHLVDSAKVVDNAGHNYSAAEQLKARHEIRAMGASGMDTLAMAAGGMAGFEAANLTIAFRGLGGSAYPFASGLHFRSGFYTAGTINGAQDLYPAAKDFYHHLKDAKTVTTIEHF